MDFLKNLTLDDKEKQQAPAPAPPVAASATEPAHEHSHSGGFLGRFLGGEDKPAEPPAVTVAKPPAEPKRSSFIEKITGNHDEEPPASVAPPPVPEKHQSFIAKLADKFDGDDDPKPPPVPAKEVHESFIGKLFHGKDDPPPPPPPKPEGFLDKVTDAFKGDDSAGDKEADLKRREAALKLREEELEKQRKEIGGGGGGFLDGLLHRDSDLPPSKKEMEKAHILDRLALFNHDEPKEDLGVRSKINAMLGGGKDGEKDEDHLDKAIDLVQQHILKSGDQSHETFLEQMKDEQISDAIRRQYKNLTGHDFPLKDKE